jgi:hypothetical protein
MTAVLLWWIILLLPLLILMIYEYLISVCVQKWGANSYSVQFISLSIHPLQGQRPHGYRNSKDYNQLGPIIKC